MNTTVKQREYFEKRLDYWARKVCPAIRPRLQKGDTAEHCLAEVVTYLKDSAAYVCLDHKAGERPLSDFDETALHEMLHSMLMPLCEPLEATHSTDFVARIEHAIIFPLINTLLRGDK